jgi:hypothetical protein
MWCDDELVSLVPDCVLLVLHEVKKTRLKTIITSNLINYLLNINKNK